MLKVLVPTLMLILTTWAAPLNKLWSSVIAHSTIIALISLNWLTHPMETNWHFLSHTSGVDPISTPLLILTTWLFPLMILASQNHTSTSPGNRQRTYITLLCSLQFFLILTFNATDFLMFYIMFEATLIPTLIIITRWGNQTARLNAGTYFLFYTLAGSIPLLVALLSLLQDLNTLSLLTLQFSSLTPLSLYTDKLWWAGCVAAFLVKMPLYGAHLWLPKAHVEAPIAGSMVLAGVLLKLGGYGIIRIMTLLDPLTKELGYIPIVFALWGVIMTGMICLRQTDLKSLIAYSSVSHMGLVAAGILTQTPWAISGALILMIAHGLTSSALFCLANTNYERIHSRTLILARGLQLALPLTATWWLLASLANLALPPLPNLMGELFIITSLFNWSAMTIILTGTGTLIAAAYSLYMFTMTQRGPLPEHAISLDPAHTREHLLIALHLLPLVLLALKPGLAMN